MRITKSGKNYYVIRSIMRDGKRSSEVVERLGTDEEIMRQHNCTDAHALHANAGFRTDYEIIRRREMKGICRRSKE